MMTRAILGRPCASGTAFPWALDRSDTRLEHELGGAAVLRPAGVRMHRGCVRRLMACGWGDGARAALDPAGPKGESTAKGRGEVRHT